MLKKQKTTASKKSATKRTRKNSSKFKRSPKKRVLLKAKVARKPKKALIPESTYPLFRKRKGVIKLRVPGPGPVNNFNQEHSKKEVIAKRAVRESNKDASIPFQKSA